MDKPLPIPKRGEIWLVKGDKIKEFSKRFRPFFVISNDIQNKLDKRIIVVPFTTEDIEKIQSFEVFVNKTPENGLDEDSKILLNYPFAIFKKRLKERVGIVREEIGITWERTVGWKG